jgi:hypothetical protein
MAVFKLWLIWRWRSQNRRRVGVVLTQKISVALKPALGPAHIDASLGYEKNPARGRAETQFNRFSPPACPLAG